MNKRRRRSTTVLREQLLASETLLAKVDEKLLGDAANVALLAERYKIASSIRDTVRLITVLRPQ